MDNTTIEDVLKKNIKVTTIGKESNYEWPNHNTLLEAIYAAMQEWASLTPSNEKYGWVVSNERRPEKSGEYITKDSAGKISTTLFLDKHWHSETGHPVSEWLDESTPIPILTPCVELEKEVERLKGLLKASEERLSKMGNIDNWK